MKYICLAACLSIGLAPLTLGCESKSADNTANDRNAPADVAHSHSEGPHGGHVLELGDEAYHAEYTHDHDTHTVLVYLLDSAVKNPVSGDDNSVTLKVFEDQEFVDHPFDATNEDGGFSLVDEELCHQLHDGDFHGRLHVTIAGKEYVAMIEHEAHGQE